MSPDLSRWFWGYPIDGRAIAADVRRSLIRFQPAISARQNTVAIVRFEPPSNSSDSDRARFDAACVSMNQKIRAFEFLGCNTERIEALPFDLSPPAFRNLIDQLNRNPQIRGIIVQYPVSRLLEPFVGEIAPEKDLDALSASSPFAVPATSEGIVRIVEPFARDALIAVVGARGFVGQGVVQQLYDRGFSVLALDQRDLGFAPEDLLQVRNADIVISTTGQPELLDERHLVPDHRLVVDSGFINLGDRIYGDIRASARAIAQNFTPVPGGIGPTEMAVLLERFVNKELAAQFNPWQLEATNSVVYLTRSQVQQQQQEWAATIYSSAVEVFNHRLSTQPDTLQTDENGVLVLPGENYSLRLDRVQNTFAIEGTRGRGTLVLYDLSQETAMMARGLTAIDTETWVEFQRQILTGLQQDEEQKR